PGHNFEAPMARRQKRMLDAGGNLQFEEAARLRDEIRRLRETELVLADDPLARQEDVEARGGSFGRNKSRAGGAAGSRARKPRLDERGARGEVPGGGSGRVQGPAGLSMR